MKQTISTCIPAGTIDYSNDPDLLERARADGATLDGNLARWCNAHIAVWGSSKCRKAAIVVDPEHPQYGTPATLVYPQDRYPAVVVGGSKSGHYLFVAPVDYHNIPLEPVGTHNGYPVHDRTFTREELLANVRFGGASRVTRKRDGKYTDHGTPVAIGVARYRRDWSD